MALDDASKGFEDFSEFWPAPLALTYYEEGRVLGRASS
jgi:hypothetical protein